MTGLWLGLALAGPIDALDPVLPSTRAEIALDRGTRWIEPLAAVRSDGDEWALVLEAQADILEVTWYDASLSAVDAEVVELPRGSWLRDWTQDGDSLFALLEARGGGVWLLELPIAPGPVGLAAFSTGRFVAGQLEISEDEVYVAGRRGTRSAVLWGRLDGDALGPVAWPELPRKVDLGSMSAAPAGGVDLVVHERRRRGGRTWLGRAMDGKAASAVVLSPDVGEPRLLEAERVADGDAELVLGTYATGRGRGAAGLYVSQIRDGEAAWTRTHAFGEMEGFFDYLPERAQERMSRKAARREERGRSLEVEARLVLHDIRSFGEDLLLVAEAFVPVYQTRTRTETSVVNGQTVTRTVTVQEFVGWEHTHALAAAVGRDGELRWARSLDLGERLYTTLEERVAVQIEEDAVTVRFAAHSKMIRHRIEDGVLVGEREESRLTGGDVLRAWQTAAAPWGEAFLLWGLQRVSDEGGRRKAFFLARIEE